MYDEIIRQELSAAGFVAQPSSGKANGYRARNRGEAIYFYPGIGARDGIRVIIDPRRSCADIFALPGVGPGRHDGLRHGDSMTLFPAKIRNGDKPSPYGRVVRTESASALRSVLALLGKATAS